VGQDRRWRVALAVMPDHAAAARFWPAWPRHKQGPGDLGRRMSRAAARHAGPVIIVGSDIPGLSRDVVAEALAHLRGADVVIGPAEDGGYWLIGWRHGHRARGALRHVRWSGPNALADTVQSLPPAAKVTYAATLRDLDTVNDLQALKMFQRSLSRGNSSTKLQGRWRLSN
jgi:glycosyltransferase A (GT-A) superfamily protein (DUF2064 family)